MKKLYQLFDVEYFLERQIKVIKFQWNLFFLKYFSL